MSSPILDRLPHGRHRNLGLDLLRALAILMVMASHYANNFSAWFGIPFFSLRVWYIGELGVELFFVLSGFLIGHLLLDLAREKGRARNLLIFLVRRWVRTLPLYYLWLTILLFCMPLSAGTSLRFLTFTQNLISPPPPGEWFAVSWSLAVEEWFYVLFGCLLMGLATLMPRRFAVAVALSLFLTGPTVLRLYLARHGLFEIPMAWAVAPRLDEIAIGVLAAAIHAWRPALFRYAVPALLAGVVLILVLWIAALYLSELSYVSISVED